MVWPLSDDTNAIMLLCAWFGGEQQPLELQEYNMLVAWLHRHEYRPYHLIDGSCDPAEVTQAIGINHDRLKLLLDRRITIGFYLEEWRRRDFWILGRGDAAYPKRIRQSLRSQAPPLLFGTGEIKFLDQGGIAIIGPDPVRESSKGQAKSIADLCAQHHCPIITVGKQEIAVAAAESGLNAGGKLVWILPGPMLSEPLGKKIRHAKVSGKITLLSSRSPADQRSMLRESETGSLLMALCNSAVYVDGTDFSVDPYGLQPAMEAYISHRTCSVWSDGHATMPAERLIQEGAHSWTTEQAAVNAGFFEIAQKSGPVPSDLVQSVDANDHEDERGASGVERGESGPSQTMNMFGQNAVSDHVQGELFDLSTGSSQRADVWELTRNDPGYPKSIPNSIGDQAPIMLLGVGNQSLLSTGGLAVIGPDSIPQTRIKKVCGIAASQRRTIIVAGHLKMAREIVRVVNKHSGYIVWVLDDKVLELRVTQPYQQAISDGHLVIITAKNASGPESIGVLVAALSDEILYVDGMNSEHKSKRKDQFQTKAAALKQREVCKLLHGRTLSPEGQEIKEKGVQSWINEGGTQRPAQANTEAHEDLTIQGQLF